MASHIQVVHDRCRQFRYSSCRVEQFGIQRRCSELDGGLWRFIGIAHGWSQSGESLHHQHIWEHHADLTQFVVGFAFGPL